jgi:tetratricopeptide (TPR) repeat protein
MGREEDARPLLSMANGSAPTWDDPWARELDDLQVGYEATLTRAQNLLIAGQPDRALDLLIPMLEIHAGNPELLSTVGTAHVAAGRRSEGLRLLEQCARRHPRHYQTQLSLAQAYAAGDDLDRALRHAQKAIEINPGFGPAHAELGRLHARTNRMEQAAASLRSAVQYGADDANTRLLLGAVLERLAEWTEAKDVYERVYQRAPTSNAALGLARSRSATGDTTGAWELIAVVRSREPSHPELEATIQYVRQQEGARR